ncbi:MAG TPA: hypothetical protein VL551_22085 [Actinospica sp.]|nr:hypothetical protein [Actinospica sp.]
MKICLHGTKTEVEIVANLLRQTATDQDLFEIVNESRDYTDRPPSTLIRRYLEIRL